MTRFVQLIRAASFSTAVVACAAAQAGTVALDVPDLSVVAVGLDGLASPSSTVSFSGVDIADTEIPSFPGQKLFNPGPPGYTVSVEGPIDGSSAFDQVLSLSSIEGTVNAASSAYDDGAGSVQLTAQGDENLAIGFYGMAEDDASVTLGGSAFVLAPESELVVSGTLSLVEGGAGIGVAAIHVSGAGGVDASWGASLPTASEPFSVVFRNASDVAVDGVLSARFSVSSIPEPADVVLLLAGLGVLACARPTRRRP